MLDFGRFVEGKFENEGEVVEVIAPEDGSVCGRVRGSGPAEAERAAVAARRSFPELAGLPACERADILERTAQGLESRAGEIAEAIRLEAGKPLELARGEVGRAVATFRIASVAAREAGGGEFRRMDGHPQGRGLTALTQRVPVGPIVAISPFNFPLNLVAHKVAPAIAAGCPVVHKPARKTPLAAHLLAEALVEAGLPAGAHQVLVCPPQTAEKLVADERLALLTFTGSAEVGWRLKALAARKKTVLELGGNAAAIVEPDADLPRAARLLAAGAYAYSGQVCISVQRIYAHREIFDDFVSELLAAIERDVGVGPTSDPGTLVGPLISEKEADRVESWIEEALKGGARSLTGEVRREGALIEPVLLTGVPPRARVSRSEVFGPVALVAPHDDLEEAVRLVNDSEFGLQAGLFTHRMDKALWAFDRLEVGGVVLNDAPTRRVDHMPYGGVKGSGEGREGPRWAIEHMTEPRLMLIAD